MRHFEQVSCSSSDTGDQGKPASLGLQQFLTRRFAVNIDPDAIVIKGAYQHNLKHVDIRIPRNKLVVLTGVSGSGKSSLAFDTLYAEGLRRYIESLPVYARNYVEQMEKPKVDAIVGLNPAIAIEQKSLSNNPRSTVGTITEITNYLRLLYSRIGSPHCVECGTELRRELSACPRCDAPNTPLLATHFSPNTPAGMCPACHGLGTVLLEVDPALVIDRPHISLLDGACRLYGELRTKSKLELRALQQLARYFGGVDLELPWCELPQQLRDVVLYGTRGETIDGEEVKGVIYHINRLFRETKSEDARLYYASFMRKQPCLTCGGTRLGAAARAVVLGGKRIFEVGDMPITAMFEWLTTLYETLPDDMREVADEALCELARRLQFLRDVGLHYLTLDRPAPTLSGGEGQRIRLASQLGLDLVGMLYVLDEPSIGLHPRDQHTLIETLRSLQRMGNTVLVVEHDEAMIRAADWVIDIGPGAGTFGGMVVVEGPPERVMDTPDSLTGQYLSGALSITTPRGSQHRSPRKGWLTLTDVCLHNLKHVEARFPLGLLTCVTGVSGSGKSSLIAGTLYPALHRTPLETRSFDRIEGADQIKKVITITQEPIGRTPRSNPATYVGLFNLIRDLFAQTPEAVARGYGAARFSFNVAGGRCEACQGSGLYKIDMHFLSDVWLTCKECKGSRFNEETLAIRYRGKTITEVLDLDVREALTFFEDQPKLAYILQTMHNVGLDYLKLGQSTTTLSGGEAQRIKLATELCRPAAGRALYLLDEPTIGLHAHDVQRLLDILHHLVDMGNTVIVVEHNLDVIKNADWVIDLGPEGGENGGYIVACGSPEVIARTEASYTGQFLRPLLSL